MSQLVFTRNRPPATAVVAQQLLVAVDHPVAPGERPVKGAGAAGGGAWLDRGASRCYLHLLLLGFKSKGKSEK